MQQIQYDVRPGEFADAMKTTRAGRAVFWLAAGAVLLLQLAAFGLVDAGGVLDGHGPAAAVRPAVPATAPAAQPATVPAKADAKTPAEDKKAEKNASSSSSKKSSSAAKASSADKTPAAPAAKASSAGKAGAATTAAHARPAPAAPAQPPKAQQWRAALNWGLAVSKFVGLVAAALLTLTLLFAVTLSLTGRLGATAELTGAFYWSLILLAMLTPWQQILTGSAYACGATFSLGDLLAARARMDAGAGSAAGMSFYYGRFVGYPVAALLVWLAVQLRFAQGCARMHFPHAAPLVPQPAVTPAAGPGNAKPATAPTTTERRPAPAVTAAAAAAAAAPIPRPPGRPMPPGPDRPAPQGSLTERLVVPKDLDD